MKSDFGTLAIVQDDGVVQIVLHRPEARNAISHQMQAEIDVALDAAEIDPEVKAVVLRGEGAIFSAGHDLKEQMGGQSFPDLTFPSPPPRSHPGCRGRGTSGSRSSGPCTATWGPTRLP